VNLPGASRKACRARGGEERCGLLWGAAGRGTIPRAGNRFMGLAQWGRNLMSRLSRRDFLGQTAVAVGVAAAGGLATPADDEPRKLKSAADRVTLGRTGVQTSLLGMGTGSVGVKHSSNQVKLGEEKFRRLVRYAYDKGITYFDLADQYGSHIY